jgi:uncharacterized protein
VSILPGRRAKATAFAILAGVCLLAFGAAELKIPPSPDRWVTDTAGFLTPATVQELDRTLETYEQESGHQVIVYIGKTTDGYPIEEYATKAFQAWRVGRKGLDDGLVLFIMAEDRKIRIEVGYGLEPTVPDIIAGRIINDIMVPRIRSGDQDGAVRDAVASVIQTISGTPPAAGPGQQPESPVTAFKGKRTAETIFVAIAAIFFLILFITNPSLAFWLLFNILSGGRGGGGGGRGGGGFGGGGGRSGGGGASGGW